MVVSGNELPENYREALNWKALGDEAKAEAG